MRAWAVLVISVVSAATPPNPPRAVHQKTPRIATTNPVPRTAAVRAIRGLYDAFNARDAELAGSFLTDDCVYEDLLLGPATVCRGKEAFVGALSMHPAFISDRIVNSLPAGMQRGLPSLSLELVVDSVADGRDAVGVEWHVELAGSAIPLGRGLTHAIICPRTGKITRVVDIAEAPWRTVGIAVAPVVSAIKRVARLGTSIRSADRDSAAIAFATVWCLISAVAVSSWLFGAEASPQADVDAMEAVVEAMPPPTRTLPLPPELLKQADVLGSAFGWRLGPGP